MTRNDLNATADALLRSSLPRGVASSASTSSRKPAGEQKLPLDDLQVLSTPSSKSSGADRPPSYGATQRTTRQRPPFLGMTPNATLVQPARSHSTQSNSVTPFISAAEAQRRVRQVQHTVDKANAKVPGRNTKGLFQAMCSTDVLFLVDTTSSMKPYIDAAKDQIQSIITRIQRTFLGESMVRVAVVGYKDHCNNPNVEFLDFTTSIDDARTFLGGLKARGGEGWTADALGGLRQACNATWMHPSRCIIHIADAPAHGNTLHDMPEEKDKKYYTPGSEPHGLMFDSVIQSLVETGLNYTFLNIRSSTDRMVNAFSRIYETAGADIQLLPSNKYHDATHGSKSTGGTSRPGASSSSPRLLFQELRLGEDIALLQRLVLKTVTDSITRTANPQPFAFHNSKASPASSVNPRHQFGSSLNPASARNDAVGSVDVCLEAEPAQWNSPNWLDRTWDVEGYCPEVIVYSDSTLADMMDSNDNIKLSFTQWTIHARSKPFGQGAQRIASYARIAASANQFVVKSFITGGKGIQHMIEDMRVQALCKAFALEFNGLVRTDQSIDFLATACLKGKTNAVSADEEVYMSLEPYLPGDYVKYNNNTFFVREDTPEDSVNRNVQAFSHFTYERSWGHFMVVDLQGLGNVLTDPAIHTKDPEKFKMNDVNLNSEGFKCFFALHNCNEVCQQLGLVSNRDMAATGVWKFRQRWPAMEPTVCCSNKICQRIVRLASSKSSPKFPGHHWCDACWPQLQSSTIRWICAAPGDHHEFDVCRFFYTSQGKFPPRECPEHVENDATASTTAFIGGSIWSQMKAGSKRSVVLGNEY
ncbi:kinase-like protein [Ophiobolus disseminans]|uniref:Kinase-like protein n=1 Tax=Ophiobolus disseminans TaxID=1469910 RepID=A0A6A6ZRD2_9PLEO|nr:kinase-like protein [Ophiobolus disseminans]